jgi:hypothetical protein
MDTEKLNLIVRNLELLVHSLKQELNSAPKEVVDDENATTVPFEADYDEVFSG